MNIYSQKQVWKFALAISALLIIGSSFWYTSRLAKRIENEERYKVKLWADAIQNKAQLVQYTNDLFDKLEVEERKKVELWAEATKKLASNDPSLDYSFVLKVVADNTTVPVILADDEGNAISHRNLENSSSPQEIREEMKEMALKNEPIEVSIYGGKKNYLYFKDSRLFSELKTVLDDLVKSFISEIAVNSASVPVLFMNEDLTKVISFGNVDSTIVLDLEKRNMLLEEMSETKQPLTIQLGNKTSFIYYQDSDLLSQLHYFPYIQFAIIGLFILVSYWLFSLARRSEQNQVWVGLAKETAHQLGTPLSSLMAWMEILKSQGVEEVTTQEMSKDIQRLELITDRFSKIGSVPKLVALNLNETLKTAVDYIKNRSSSKINFDLQIAATNDVSVNLNLSLFNWVIENLCKNAIDAMNGTGSITVLTQKDGDKIIIDVTDTGSGISSNKHKAVFEPGFTTKKRGWGLGLSLVKRIVESYHSGKIFVKTSSSKGTTFRIVLST